MDTKDGALRPEVFTIKNYINQEKDIDILTTEEKIIAAGADNAFWGILKGHFEHEIEKLEQLNDNAMSNGLSEQEIGRNTIVISLTKGTLRRIIGVVQDAKEAAHGRAEANK